MNNNHYIKNIKKGTHMKLKGVLFSSIAASLWGISGISGEILFKKYNFSSNWLVSARTLVSGILLLSVVIFIQKKSISEIFKNKKDFLGLILFGSAGMYLVQFTYFKTIELSNVSFATIMQFTAPFYIFIFESIKYRRKPTFSTILLLITTALGVTAISTKGDFKTLSVSFSALFIGIFSAMMIAFYSIYPKKLLKKYGSLTIVGCGMLVGSCIANIFHPFWKIEGEVNLNSLIQIFIVIIIGTTIAYLMYMTSLKHISSSLAGILTVFEPIVATILSLFIFSLTLSFVELIGFILVFISIFALEKRL